MRYLQVLMKNRHRYQLCWLPEWYAIKGVKLNIKGDYTGIWEVKEVYKEEKEEIRQANQILWESKVSPYLEGEKLQERLQQYRKMKKMLYLEEV